MRINAGSVYQTKQLKAAAAPHFIGTGEIPFASPERPGSDGVEDYGEWKNGVVNGLNKDSLNLLFRNMIPYIRITNFASADECESLTRQASSHGFSPYRGVEPTINRIGHTVFEYDKISKERYFEDAAKSLPIQSHIFSEAFNPIKRLVDLIQDETGVRPVIAKDLSGRPYYAGLIRRIENGTLIHVDYAPTEQNAWEVCDVISQLSWNLYLRVSDPNEGNTRIYNKQWEIGHRRFREGSYGYSPEVVKGCESAVFEPTVGDLVIFNTRNFHAVESTKGERVTVTSALGLMPDGKLILWS